MRDRRAAAAIGIGNRKLEKREAKLSGILEMNSERIGKWKGDWN